MKYLDALAASLLVGLASYAIWRFIAVDVLTKGIRKRLFSDKHLERTFYQWLKIWLQCPWCAGAWITALVTLSVDIFAEHGLPVPLLVFAAARAITGWVGAHDEDYQEMLSD